MAGFTCFFTFLFLLALVVPLFLRLHLNLGCYVPYVIERSFILVVTFLFVGFAITLRCNTTVYITSQSHKECNSPNSSATEEIEAQQELRGTEK